MLVEKILRSFLKRQCLSGRDFLGGTGGALLLQRIIAIEQLQPGIPCTVAGSFQGYE